ncbi:MAG TPA: aminomethyltransferase family protein [Blastocatellia bacterium]|nr:aminomethyltransferase family protein [Blastocatellia bacterium]
MKRTPLYDKQQAAGGDFIEFAGYETPGNFGDCPLEYNAIRQATAMIDLSYRGRLEISGQDRIQFLQSISSNDIKAVNPGGGIENSFLTTMGKVVGYGRFYVNEESVFIDIDGDAIEATKAYLDKYLKLSRSEMKDVSEAIGHLSIQGPRARQLVKSLAGIDLPSEPLQHIRTEIAGNTAMIAKVSHTGEDGYDIFMDSDTLPAVWDLLVEKGREFEVRPAGFEALNTARVEAGIPIFGVDFDENNILVEANLESAVSYTKGCYVGQEIIARLHYRGHVAKRLALLEIDGETRPIPGDKIFKGTKEVGQVTSAVKSPLLGKPLAFGLVKYEPSQIGTELGIDSSGFQLPAKVIAPPRSGKADAP